VDKRTYYQQREVVENYDSWRFGSPGGQYVDAREKAALLDLLGPLDRSARVLDMPCGTGRLLRSLGSAGFTSVVGADASPAMLEQARIAAPSFPAVEADAFATPFESGSFQAVCSLRFLFHVEQAPAFFAEVARILKPGGLFVFDTLLWTPRGFLPAIDRKLGGRLFCYSEARVGEMLRSQGLTVQKTIRVLALPSLVYRFLPAFLLRPVGWFDRNAWGPLFTKAFVLAAKDGHPGDPERTGPPNPGAPAPGAAGAEGS